MTDSAFTLITPPLEMKHFEEPTEVIGCMIGKRLHFVRQSDVDSNESNALSGQASSRSGSQHSVRIWPVRVIHNSALGQSFVNGTVFSPADEATESLAKSILSFAGDCHSETFYGHHRANQLMWSEEQGKLQWIDQVDDIRLQNTATAALGEGWVYCPVRESSSGVGNFGGMRYVTASKNGLTIVSMPGLSWNGKTWKEAKGLSGVVIPLSHPETGSGDMLEAYHDSISRRIGDSVALSEADGISRSNFTTGMEQALRNSTHVVLNALSRDGWKVSSASVGVKLD